MIFAAALASPATDAAPVKSWPLDERTAYTVRLGLDAPTTIAFPGAVTALEGANVSTRADDNPALLLSHQPGSNFFSLRALRPNATGAINAIHRGKIIALTFTTGPDPDRAITFRDPAESAPPPRKSEARAARWLSLLDQAKRHDLIADQYPALAERITRRKPGSVGDSGGLTITIEELFRITPEDALVFRLRLENPTNQPVHYAPTRLMVRVAHTGFPVALADADGLVPAKTSSTVWLVVAHATDGTSPGLSLDNTFSVDVPRLP